MSDCFLNLFKSFFLGNGQIAKLQFRSNSTHRQDLRQGVFCQSAIENAQKDHAAVVQNILDNKDIQLKFAYFFDSKGHWALWSQESHLKKIKALFTKIGADDTGIITFEMLQEQFGAPAVKEYFESLGLDVSDAWSFFKLLDADGGQGHAFGVRLNRFEFVFFCA